MAGTDSSGGAGVVADCRTFDACEVWPAIAVTAVTAQGTTGVVAAEPISPGLVALQIEVVARSFGLDAVKTGMLATAEIVAAVANALARVGGPPLVVDPVLASSHGQPLLGLDGTEGAPAAALAAMRQQLLPMAVVVTPNLAEAAALLGTPVRPDRDGMDEAGRALLAMGPRAVLVTGGHLSVEGDTSPDCLVTAGGTVWLEGPRLLPEPAGHGTGCVLSAAICAGLARGVPVVEACRQAKELTARAITARLPVRTGVGPVDPNPPPVSASGAGP